MSPAHASSYVPPSMAKRNVEGPAGQAPASSPAPRDSQPSREHVPTLNHLFGGKSKECESRKLSISDHNVSSLKMQSEAREASQRNCNNASILTKGLIAYLKQSSDTQEIVRWIGGSWRAALCEVGVFMPFQLCNFRNVSWHVC